MPYSPLIQRARKHLAMPRTKDSPPRRTMRSPSERGFTLIELMVVIVIIGLLATVVVLNVLPSQDRAMVEKARADVSRLETAMELYRLHLGTYPTTDQGLNALVEAPANLSRRDRYQPGGYVKNLPEDPWGNPYRYIYPGERNPNSFDLFSLGADGRLGGEGLNADVGNWN